MFGLRTTDGWLPSTDWGPEGTPPSFERFGVCGPMARSFADLDLVLRLFAARFPLPARATPAEPRRRKLAFTDSLLVPCDDDTASVMRRLRQSLVDHGYQVHDARPDVDFERAFVDWCLIAGYEYLRSFPKWLVTRFAKRFALDRVVLRKLGTGTARTRMLEGASLARADYEQALERRHRALATVDAFFQRYDAWVLPCSPSSALPLAACGKPVATASGPVDYTRFLGAYLIPTAYLGTPAVAFPAGSDARGLPIGVQAHGARFGDRELLDEVSTWPVPHRVPPRPAG